MSISWPSRTARIRRCCWSIRRRLTGIWPRLESPSPTPTFSGEDAAKSKLPKFHRKFIGNGNAARGHETIRAESWLCHLLERQGMSLTALVEKVDAGSDLNSGD